MKLIDKLAEEHDEKVCMGEHPGCPTYSNSFKTGFILARALAAKFAAQNNEVYAQCIKNIGEEEIDE